MISKSALKIFGFDVVWKDRSLAGTKLLVICPTISKDGNLLMEKMLFSIGFHLKDDNVLIIRSELKNYRKNELVNDVVKFLEKDKKRPICTPFSK